MNKVYYVTKLSVEECYILKELEFNYILMTCDIYNSRPWGDPPYWNFPDQLDRHNYHFIADKDNVKTTKDAECYKLQLQKLFDDFIKNKNSIECEIWTLKMDKELLEDEYKEMQEKLEQKIKELENE